MEQRKEFYYVRVLYISEDRADHADILMVCCGEERIEAKVSLHPSPHKLWVVTERMRSRIQVMEMSFLRRVPEISIRDG